MMKKAFLIPILLWSSVASSGILPDIFYAEESEKARFCRSSDHESETYWRKLVDEKISELIGDKAETTQNAMVSLSYLELFRKSGNAQTKFMAYVYANASHHLGRLVRFSKWPENHPLKDTDQKLVKGFALRIAAGTVNHELSKRLMVHSLKLYKELAWSLAAGSLCGQDYALALSSDPNLVEAFSVQNTADFIRPFVTYEQTFLQKTMYSDFLIGSSAKARMLDEMRFISFNGEEQTSFADWSKGRISSFDLGKRIEFDVWSILKELETGKGFEERVQKAKVEETAKAISSSLPVTH